MEIAGKLTISDWTKLDIKADVEKSWDKAFEFFEERINTRYLKPIQAIQSISCNLGEGFAMVNLQCSLIETIESFVNGWIYYYPKYKKNGSPAKCPWKGEARLKNVHIFESFFKNREPFKMQTIDGESFFYHVRCGLLHETQTKNGWVIHAKHSDESIFFDKKEEQIVLFRNNFQRAILKVIQDYKTAIISGSDFGELKSEDLRNNFKAKFDYICDISKFKK